MAASCPLQRALPLALAAAIALLLAGCGPAVMSVEEAKKATASFEGAAFVPPPRTIQDVTAILEQQKAEDPVALAEARRKVEQPPPATKDPAVLAEFFYERGTTALDMGRTGRAIENLERALEHARQARTPAYRILARLGFAHMYGGGWIRTRTYVREAAAVVPSSDRGWLFSIYQSLVLLNIALGDLKEAERALGDLLALERESRRQAWS